ncbi:MAG TPA: amidohydrolase family protein [Gaiellaceae bacterium]|nr:amidohydrolase family protein [Gaiellaceae bacterium]
MQDPLERARAVLAAYDREVAALLPEDAELFDAHVHVGQDIDGFVATLDDLLAFLAHDGVRRAFAFCLDEPDREPAFQAANDRTLEAARRSNGVIVPFARLDLADRPAEEAARSLDLGARGIKLHPRAQRFLLDDERLAPIFALAAERRVPILIHGGRGLPPIADHLRRLVDDHPEAQLIIAHAGIADLARLCEVFAGHTGVFFDTSVWSSLDLLDMFHRVSPEQVLYASDFPYGQQPGSLFLLLRTARLAGLSEEQIRDVLGRTAAGIADGRPPAPRTPPLGRTSLVQPITLARIHHYLAMATPLLWTRQRDTIGVLGLALNTCAERDGFVDERERIAELIASAKDLWSTLPELEDDLTLVETSRLTFRLVHLADILAVTTTAE